VTHRDVSPRRRFLVTGHSKDGAEPTAGARVHRVDARVYMGSPARGNRRGVIAGGMPGDTAGMRHRERHAEDPAPCASYRGRTAARRQ